MQVHYACGCTTYAGVIINCNSELQSGLKSCQCQEGWNRVHSHELLVSVDEVRGAAGKVH